MKDVQLCEKGKCTGCMACKQKCRPNAIVIKRTDGFNYPSINKNICKQCGLCVSVCPIINEQNKKGNCHEEETKCLAAWNKDNDIRMKSSSGGTFSVLAEYVLSIGGRVYGAAWNNEMYLVHRGIDEIKDLDSLRRSKYVQSDTANTFREVYADLNAGIKVLYCGTPCQVAGLISFLGNKEYDNLYTVDVLCQGVPSPYLFKKYIEEIETETGWKVVDANFRTKEHGWRCGLYLLLLVLRSPDGKKTKTINRVLNRNEYYNAFYREYFMRPSCYDCQFKCDHQGYYADLTIADFWRIGDKIPLDVKDYTKGISAVVINSDKGRAMFEACTRDMVIIERTWKEFSTNGGLRSSHKPKNNDAAFDYLQSHTWCETQRKYFPMSWRRKVLNFLYLTIGEKNVRKIIKRTI